MYRYIHQTDIHIVMYVCMYLCSYEGTVVFYASLHWINHCEIA